MQQDTALKEGEACLPIGAAFDPFHFVDEPLNHTVAPGQAPSVGHSLPIIDQPIDKSDQLGNPTGLDSRLPLLQTHLPLAFSRASDRSPAQARTLQRWSRCSE